VRSRPSTTNESSEEPTLQKPPQNPNRESQNTNTCHTNKIKKGSTLIGKPRTHLKRYSQRPQTHQKSRNGEQNANNHPSNLFRLERTPIDCFQSHTSNFNRTHVSVRIQYRWRPAGSDEQSKIPTPPTSTDSETNPHHRPPSRIEFRRPAPYSMKAQ
jgi:hypothetical protein